MRDCISIQKVGGILNRFEIAQNIIEKFNGVAKTSQLIAGGLSNYDIKMLCNEDLIKKIRQGVYGLPNANSITEEKLIQTVLPEIVVCLESALFHYGYSDFTPRKWSIAVPRSMSMTKINSIDIPFNIFYLPLEKLYLGQIIADFNGTELSVYDRDKTICDCFKYQNKIDNELFNKAINAYVADDNKNLANLAKYAKEMRVYKKVMTIMEVMLNG